MNTKQELAIMHEKTAVTTSLKVAEIFGKEHKNVIQTIEDKIQSAENSADYKNMFAEGTYKDGRNREQKMYYMNRDGFSFIAFGFTGKKADNFKLQYIDAFNHMEATLKKIPAKKLDPVIQAELSITRTKTAKANALYRIAKETTSESAKQQLLAQAAEVLTGEMTIPVMKQKEYTATEIGDKLAISPNKVGRICNKLGLKAEQPGQNEYGRWSNSKSQHSDKEVPQWLYFEKGYQAIKKEHLAAPA